jgi:hypothetical protein
VTDSTSASRVIPAPAESIFAVLADPATHAAIDGTGWVCDTVGHERLTAAGQVFRMAMYHPNHPDGNYTTANRVDVFEPPTAVSWWTGYDADDGTLKFGGWFWRYDLAPEGPSSTTVTLTYDWTATSQETRDLIGFPPFGPGFLRDSLDHLAEQVAARR